MLPFYKAPQIPTHSCQMLETPEEARSFPRRDLALGFCETCGFVSNVIFDPAVQQYSIEYQAQQSYSSRFRSFQTSLIHNLIQRYGLRNKDVIEIGCGKGDFLFELCEAGHNRGIGIDPACDTKRVYPGSVGSVRLIADLYSEDYAGLPCDFLCCRHTLEHIHQTHEFVALIRKVIASRENILVFFEVPDVERVLRKAAFWDIYYEHCSYFSLGSLGRLFSENRFHILELAKDYDDQYLLIVARPANNLARPVQAPEMCLGALGDEVRAFSQTVRGRIDPWRKRIGELKDAGKRVAIWGSGSKCVSFLSTVGVADRVDAIVDINPHRHGKFLPGSGKRVAPPEVLQVTRPDVIFVMNPIYCDEIQEQIDGMDISAELVPME